MYSIGKKMNLFHYGLNTLYADKERKVGSPSIRIIVTFSRLFYDFYYLVLEGRGVYRPRTWDRM